MHFGYAIIVGLGRNNAINSQPLDVNGKLMLGPAFIALFLKIKLVHLHNATIVDLSKWNAISS